LFAAVADGLPRGGDPAGQGGLRDDASVPDRRQQIILAGDTIPVRDEICQEIEYLWFDLDQLGAAPQLTPLEVERVVAEQKAHPGLPTQRTLYRGGNPARPQAKIATLSGINQDFFKVGRYPSLSSCHEANRSRTALRNRVCGKAPLTVREMMQEHR
jgi:hypothetical protein